MEGIGRLWGWSGRVDKAEVAGVVTWLRRAAGGRGNDFHGELLEG
jgi:hypothetical protein